MAPINFGGDTINEITMDGDQIQEVTMDGDVVWTADGNGGGDPSDTLMEDFEGYSTQADLESTWNFGVVPAAYELVTSGALVGSQSIRCVQHTGHAPNAALGTSWGGTYSVLTEITNASGSPGLTVQHQDAENRLSDGYWARLDHQEDALFLYERNGGTTTQTIAQDGVSLSQGNQYRIEVELDGSNDTIAARAYPRGDSSPIGDTGFGSPNTTHTGGHLMLNGGRNADTDPVRFDQIIDHA